MGDRAGTATRAMRWGSAAMLLGTAIGLVPLAPAHAQVGAPSRDDLTVGRDNAPPPTTPLSVEDNIERGPCPLAEPAFANARVTFSSVEFTGLPGISAAELAPAWSEFANRDLPITALCEVRDRAATMLRARGFLAAVQIPPQRIEKGGVARMD